MIAGTEIIPSHKPFIRRVKFPVNTIHLSPFFFAVLMAFITFLLLPEVVIPIAISSFSPKASICLENTKSNPRSFPIAVMADVSVANEIAGIAFRFFENLTVSSVAKCWASEALPPFPKKKNLFFSFERTYTNFCYI